MTEIDWVNVFATLGFPAGMSVALLWLMTTRLTRQEEKIADLEKRLCDTIDSLSKELTSALNSLDKSISLLLDRESRKEK